MDGPRICSAARALEVVGDRWALLVLREAFLGDHRFDEMQRRTGAPRDILAARLKKLVAAGVLERRLYQERPPRYEYHLTEAGARPPHGHHRAAPVGRPPRCRRRATPGDAASPTRAARPSPARHGLPGLRRGGRPRLVSPRSQPRRGE